MDSISSMVLVVVFLAAFANYRNGTLGPWAKAKFFNQEPSSGGGDWDAPGAKPASFVAPAVGRLVAPVTGGTVTGVFGDPREGHRHAGIDWAVPIGTPVRASAAGRVTSAGAAGGYGLRVDVDHGNGRVTRYAHLDRLLVRVGDILGAGELLGRSGNTGTSTGPHLHFEVLQGGRPVNPAQHLGSLMTGAV